MKDFDSFDHRPDPTIGRLLREHLASTDDADFILRVRAAAREAGIGRRDLRPWLGRFGWDVPDDWFRPGIAAAAAILVGALLGVGIVERAARPVWLAESLRPEGAPAEFFADQRPDPELLLTRLLEAP